MKSLTAVSMAACLLVVCGAAVAQEAEPAADLPVTSVMLFSSGVGYFERSGQVEGGSSVRLMFKTEDINDILKSMVILGPEQVSVNYAPRDPVTKALKSFAVDITGSPTFGELLAQLRGASVLISAPEPYKGAIVGVEKRTKIVDDQTMTVDVLTVLTDVGLVSFELPSVTSVKLLEPGLEKELARALAVLAAARDKNKKPVTIHIGSKGKQEISIGYVVESPVWKTSYRLVLSDDDKPLLQGWAIVENTSDTDWKDVSLTLVSGQPISFVQDLYTPMYVTRQVVRPERYATLRAQAYESDMEMDMVKKLAEDRAPGAPAKARGRRMAGAAASLNYLGNRMAADQGRTKALAKAGALKVATSGAGAVAELFTYPIAGKVTIERQKSAMLPIVSQMVAAERLSIYDPASHKKFPLSGMELTNSTGLYLMQGPITVFDGGTYAGDARISDLPAGDKRLISYSLDQKREVAVRRPSKPSELVSLKVTRGVLIATRKFRREANYTINNKGDKERTVLIQQPLEADWKLVEPEGVKPATPTQYRFRVKVAAKKGDKNGVASLKVLEERTEGQRIYLTNETPNRIMIYIKTKQASKALIAALQKIIEQKNAIAEVKRDIVQRKKELARIEKTQARTRENMKVLDKTSKLYNDYVKDWGEQEKQYKQLEKANRDLEVRSRSLEKQLNKDIQALNVG